MKERPILFNGEMVRAILEGRKTQTRRVVKPQPILERGLWKMGGQFSAGWSEGTRSVPCMPGHSLCTRGPYGSPGDRLWVRETWGVATRPCPYQGWRDGIEYRADVAWMDDERDLLPLHEPEIPDEVGDFYGDYDKEGWRPSIHMPRWASRIMLEVKAVRVERLQEITEEDARAEGVEMVGPASLTSRSSFAKLWDSINAKRGYGWDTNPWVWVVEFELPQPPEAP